MNKLCLKGTSFSCPCDRCMEELRRKAQAHHEHLTQLKSDTARYWTGHYSARDKADAVIILHAGFVHQEGCACLFCQVEREASNQP
jgi:hypothetical protein